MGESQKIQGLQNFPISGKTNELTMSELVIQEEFPTKSQEIYQRRKDVLELIIMGKPKHELVRIINEKYGVRLSAIEQDITACRKELHNYHLEKNKNIITDHIARYERIYEKNIVNEEKNYQKVAMQALRNQEELLKLHDSKIAINNNQQNNIQTNINLDNLTPDDLKNLLKNLHE